MKIFLTGGSGYIGSVTSALLLDRGHEVMVFDNLERGHREAVDPRAQLVVGDLKEERPVAEAVKAFLPDAVFHFAAYALFMAIAMLIVSLDNKDFSTTVTSVISTVNNIGPIIGPVGHFADFSVLSKIVFSIAMLVGRLEIYPVLVLFSPYMWTRK